MNRPLVSFARLARVVFTSGVAALLGSLAMPADAVTIDMVTVGNAGNLAQSSTNANQNGFGAVTYVYQIGKYEVTIGQYTEFLNAVATTDTYSLYNTNMGTDQNRGIQRTGSSGSYTYSVINNGGNSANRPITFVSWFDAARFANWLANGQPTGLQSSTTTENGAYNVNGVTSGTTVAKNATNPNTNAAPTFYIPTENEWYKAAYFSAVLNSGSGGYYTYATQSNTAPGNVIGSGANQANYNNGVYSVTQSGSYSTSQNYLTGVGAFTNSASFYGTFDQSGNLDEWNDLNGTGGSSVGPRRGGDWGSGTVGMSSAYRDLTLPPSFEYYSIGFRVAAVPEPSTWVMGLAGIACAGWQGYRRRRAR